MVGQNTVVDSAAAAAAAILAEWGPAPSSHPSLARHVHLASDVAQGAAAAAGKLSHALSRTGPAALTVSSSGRAVGVGDEEAAPTTAGPYGRLAWTVFLGAMDVGLVLTLLFWPAPDALCTASVSQNSSRGGEGWAAPMGGEDGVWAAILSGVFLHAVDMVRPMSSPVPNSLSCPLKFRSCSPYI